MSNRRSTSLSSSLRAPDDHYKLDVKRRCPAFEKYVVRVITEDQAEAINFVVLRMIQMAEEIQALFLGAPAEPQVRS